MKVLKFAAVVFALVALGRFSLAGDFDKPGDFQFPESGYGAACRVNLKPAGPGDNTSTDTVLYDFRADWCGPCRSMDPAVHQLASQGFPVKQINIDQDRELASRFGVQGIPCFVMVVNGKEVDRVVGATDISRLEAMFSRNGVGTGMNAVRGQSPDSHRPRLDAPSLASAPAKAIPFLVNDQNEIAEPPRGAPPHPSPLPGGEGVSEARSPFDRLIRSSVRLRIEDENGNSVGSGTIIDSRAGEALIITCGHVFRDAVKNGKIWVDLFGPNAPQAVAGTLIDFDLKSEVGLISIRTNYPVTAAHLAPPGYAAQAGDRVISVGCDGGANATAREAHVTSINRYVGSPNLQVDFQPVQGRSGGGLFTPDGYVIGVCYAADPEDHAGLFSALPALCDELDHAGLAFLFRDEVGERRHSVAAAEPAPSGQLAMADVGRAKAQNGMGNGEWGGGNDGNSARSIAHDSQPFSRDPKGSAGASLSSEEQTALAVLREKNEGSEVICIVRPAGNPQGHSEIVVLDHVSPDFIERLAHEAPSGSGQQLTSLQVPRNSSSAGMPSIGKASSPSNNPAVNPAAAQNTSNASRAQPITLEPWWAGMVDQTK